MVMQRKLRRVAVASALMLSACAAPNFQKKNVFMEKDSGHQTIAPKETDRFEHLSDVINRLTNPTTPFPNNNMINDMFESAVYSLAVQRDKRAVPLLLEHNLFNPPVMHTLGLLGGEDALHKFGQLLDNDVYFNKHFLLGLVGAMSRTRNRDTIPYLCRLWDRLTQKKPDPNEAKGLESRVQSMLDGGLLYEIALSHLRGAGGIGNKDQVFRAGAAFVLGWINDKESLPEIMSLAASDESNVVRHAAIYSLGMLGDQRAMGTLLDVIKQDPEFSSDWKTEAVIAITQLPKPITPELFELMGSSSIITRRSAALAAALSSDQETTNVLLQMLDDAEPYKRESAAYALGIIGDNRATEPLLRSLFDMEICQTAAVSLALLDDPRIPGLLENIYRKSTAFDGKAVIRITLRTIDPEKSTPLLFRLLETEEDKDRIADTLLRMKNEMVFPGFVRLLEHEDPDTRLVAIKSIVSMDSKSEQSMDHVLSMLDDLDWKVRNLAIQTLGRFPKSRKIESRILGVLDDENPRVQLAAIQFKWNYRIPFAKIAKVINSESFRENHHMRMSAIRTLARLGGYRELIGILQNDKNDMGRLAAAHHLQNFISKDAIEALSKAAIGDSSANVRSEAERSLKISRSRKRIIKKSIAE